jgi:putative spermidine/putrescine transport system ATP-binding protein
VSPEQSGGAALSILDATKVYRESVAVDHISLDVAAGEFLTMLGSSGSGKTTTLNAIAGFIRLTSGRILLDGQEIERLPSYKRNIGVVFQHYALFPHMTVRKNIAFPLEQRKLPKAEMERLIDEALAMVRLEGYADRYPRQLSGGQQQRVALARALVFKPRLLLMDEPLGALDKKLREWLQLEIKRIHRELGVTFIYVTHDQEEALVLSDRIAVMSNGRIEQVGSAVELYERPATQFVAEFIGESNVFRGTVSGAAGSRSLVTKRGTAFRVAGDAGDGAIGREGALIVRPERMRVVGDGGAANVVPGRVGQVIYLGSSRKLTIESAEGGLVIREPMGAMSSAREGDEVRIGWAESDGVLVPIAPAAAESVPPVA